MIFSKLSKHFSAAQRAKKPCAKELCSILHKAFAFFYSISHQSAQSVGSGSIFRRLNGGEKWKYNGWFGCCLCFCFFIRRVYCWSADNASRTNKLYGIDLLCYGVGNYFLPHRRLLYFRTSTCVGWIYLADYSWAGITGYGYFQYNFSTSY